MTNNMFHEAVITLRKGGLTEEEAEALLVDVVNEMISATDECMDADPESITEHEHELFYRIINGLTNGGMRYGTAILLLAMYETAIQERIMGMND